MAAIASTEAGGPRKHVEIQTKLALLGKELGCDIWIPRHDRATSSGEERLNRLSLRDFPSLPLHANALRTIENIDVVWIRDKTIEAAFEVESTTSIYSGLLRLSDLIASLPNISIELFILTRQARRDEVFRQVNRPTFRKIDLPKRVGYVSFETLEANFANLLKIAESPRVLKRLSEDLAVATPPPPGDRSKVPVSKARFTWNEKLGWADHQVGEELLPRLLDGIQKRVTSAATTRTVGRWLYIEDGPTFCVLWVKKRGFMVSLASDSTFKDPRNLSHEVKGFFFPKGQERRFSLELLDDLGYALDLIREGHRVGKSVHFPWEGTRRPTRPRR